MKRNPFRSEADAFRLFVIVGGAALVVVGIALLIGDRVAAYVGLAMVVFGLFQFVRWIAEAIQAPDEVGKGQDEDEGNGEG